MLQLLFIVFLAFIYFLGKHFWRNRGIYMNLYRLFSSKGVQRPFGRGPFDGGPFGQGSFGQGAFGNRVKEKRIITCTYCGSAPEISNEPCSKCGKML